MIKLAILVHDISSVGGTERVATFLANNLASIMDVTLVSIIHKATPHYKIESNVEIDYINSCRKTALIRYFKNKKFDKVIVISMGGLSFFMSILFYIFRCRTELILSEHVSFNKGNYFIRTLKLISYMLADKVVVLTNNDFNILQKSHIKNRIYKIGNASNFKIANKPNYNSKCVIAVGRLTFQKGFERLIRIWSLLENKNEWILKIIGDGEDKKFLIDLIDELNMTDNILLLPATNHIENEFNNARIIAMTSRYEGLPLVLIEAKSFGLASIAYDCETGPREIIKNNNDGYVIPYESEELFVNNLMELITNERLLKSFQYEALINSKEYSPENIIKLWIECINE
ncbi:glycosyltransferase family 4 protein [Photobacterium damselae]